MTVNDLVTSALQRLGVLAEGEVANAAQANDGLVALNDLIDQWKAERLNIYQLVTTTFPIVPSQASYTVGTGGQINIDRPNFLDHVSFTDTTTTPNVYISVDPLTDDAWTSLAVPGMLGAIPRLYWWQTTYPLGKLWLWPIPTGTTLVGGVDVQSAISEFAALTTTVALPPGYRRMLRSNLALDLAADYGVQPSPSLIKAAQDSLAVVKRSNVKMMDVSFSADQLIGNSGGSWSIYDGP